MIGFQSWPMSYIDKRGKGFNEMPVKVFLIFQPTAPWMIVFRPWGTACSRENYDKREKPHRLVGHSPAFECAVEAGPAGAG